MFAAFSLLAAIGVILESSEERRTPRNISARFSNTRSKSRPQLPHPTPLRHPPELKRHARYRSWSGGTAGSRDDNDPASFSGAFPPLPPPPSPAPPRTTAALSALEEPPPAYDTSLLLLLLLLLALTDTPGQGKLVSSPPRRMRLSSLARACISGRLTYSLDNAFSLASFSGLFFQEEEEVKCGGVNRWRGRGGGGAGDRYDAIM